MDKDFKKLFEFTKILDESKFIKRKIQLKNATEEDNAQHTYHLSLMVWIFQKNFEKKINLEKAFKLALMHDLVEIYAGDTFSFDHKARITKQKREAKAAIKLFGKLPKNLETEFKELFEEYEERQTNEAVYVQSLDKLQPLFQNILAKGASWKKYKVTEEMVRDYKTHYNESSPFLMGLFNYLLKIITKNKFY